MLRKSILIITSMVLLCLTNIMTMEWEDITFDEFKNNYLAKYEKEQNYQTISEVLDAYAKLSPRDKKFADEEVGRSLRTSIINLIGKREELQDELIADIKNDILRYKEEKTYEAVSKILDAYSKLSKDAQKIVDNELRLLGTSIVKLYGEKKPLERTREKKEAIFDELLFRYADILDSIGKQEKQMFDLLNQIEPPKTDEQKRNNDSAFKALSELRKLIPADLKVLELQKEIIFDELELLKKEKSEEAKEIFESLSGSLSSLDEQASEVKENLADIDFIFEIKYAEHLATLGDADQASIWALGLQNLGAEESVQARMRIWREEVDQLRQKLNEASISKKEGIRKKLLEKEADRPVEYEISMTSEIMKATVNARKEKLDPKKYPEFSQIAASVIDRAYEHLLERGEGPGKFINPQILLRGSKW